eukprot:PITA_34411
MRICVREDEAYEILSACHDGSYGSHFAANRTTYKILRVGYFWPTLHKYVEGYTRQCDECQRMGYPTCKDGIPLHTQVSFELFEEWVVELISPIDPPSRFVFPRELMIDHGSQFISNMIEGIIKKHQIHHQNFTPHYPKENGKVEVTNMELEGIVTKVISDNKKDWKKSLVEATWAYNTWKTTTSFTPYDLVYRKKDLLSIEF